LDCARRPYELSVDCGQTIRAKTVVIASGARYNKPNIENLEKFEGQGIYYGATHIEAQLCGNDEVIVVGGGNSAGQAAVFLSQTAGKVHMLVRSKGFSASKRIPPSICAAAHRSLRWKGTRNWNG
jgi:thioredoxin reductase (NADPH)